MPQIIDQFGHPVRYARPRRPSTISYSDREWRSLVSGTLTVDTVISYLTSAETGTLRYQMEMFDRMVERDPHLGAVLQTRRLALTQAPWAIVPADETDSRQADAAEYVRDQLNDLDELDDDLHTLLDAVPKGISVMEIVYGPDYGIDHLVEVPGKLLDWAQDDLRVVADGIHPMEMQPLKWIRHSPRLRPGHAVRRGLMRTLSILWCIAHYALEDWAGYAEVFGMPLRLGTYQPGVSQGDLDALETALKNLGSDAMGMIPETMEIKFEEPMSRRLGAHITPMEAVIKHCERKMSIAVLGQHLSTEAESGTGTLAGGAQQATKRDITRADARQLGTTIRRDLIRPLVGFRYGWDVPPPAMRWDLDDPIDEKGRAAVFRIAIGMGQPVSMAQVREELNLREPEDDDDTITPPARQGAGLPGLGSYQSFAGAREDTRGLPPGSAMRANEQLSRAAASDEAADALSQVLALVAALAEQTDTPEALLTRVKLAAPDIDDLLSDAGMSMDEFDDLVGRALITADLNGRVAVRGERKA